MGEKQTKPFQLSFNGSLKVDFQGSHVTSDGGLILVRELDERLGLGELIDEHLSDSRQGTNKQFTFADLLRQSVYSRLAGLRGPQRRRAGFDRSDVSADRLQEALGSRCGANLQVAQLRDGDAGERREPAGADGAEPRAGRASGSVRRLRAGRSGHGLHRESGPWPTGRQCLQRTLRVGLLSAVTFVQRSW